MADIEPRETPVVETPAVEDVEMEGAAEETTAGAGVEDTGLTELEPEQPKMVLFAE